MSIIYGILCLINVACLCLPTADHSFDWIHIAAGFICGGALGWEFVRWATKK